MKSPKIRLQVKKFSDAKKRKLDCKPKPVKVDRNVIQSPDPSTSKSGKKKKKNRPSCDAVSNYPEATKSKAESMKKKPVHLTSVEVYEDSRSLTPVQEYEPELNSIRVTADEYETLDNPGNDDNLMQLDEPDDNLMQLDEQESAPPVNENNAKKRKRRAVLETKVDAMDKRMDSFAFELKEIKNILNIRSKTSRNQGQIAAYCKEACEFSLLPKSKLKKVRHVEKMEASINENGEYKKQIVILFHVKTFSIYSRREFLPRRFKKCRRLEAKLLMSL